MNHEELMASRWPIARAEAYMKPYGVIKGVNFIPSYCVSYIEMWHHFDERVIRRELGYAKGAGFNSLRIFVAACQWETRRDLVKDKLDYFLNITRELGFSVMLTLQPNTYVIPGHDLNDEEDPFIINFRPGVHDGSWVYKGAQIFDCNGKWEEDREGIGAFVRDIVGCFGQDDRVAFWDLYNECHKGNIPLQEYVFSCAREMNPIQPLTACWNAQEISDITTFHCYEKPGKSLNTSFAEELYFVENPTRTFEHEVAEAESLGRPVLCTECLARTFGNELHTFLPTYSQKHFGFYVWALVAGSAQYHIPWGWPIGTPPPKRWFHCMFYPDGTPFDESEIEQIQRFDFE